MINFLKVVVIVVFILLAIYLIAWIPVVDKIINWCDKYPSSLADCSN